MNPLDLKLSVDRDRIPDHGWTDLAFGYELHNISTSDVAIYPTIAHFMPSAGWHRPAWEILLESPAFTPRIRELRTYFGPPGMPPHQSVFDQRRELLGPGKAWRAKLPACYIPRGELPASELTRDIIDPHGMDRDLTDEDLNARAVLVLMATSAELRQRSPGELLTLKTPPIGGLLAFVPTHGTLDVFMRYLQEPWSGFFKPDRTLVAESNRLTLHIGD